MKKLIIIFTIIIISQLIGGFALAGCEDPDGRSVESDGCENCIGKGSGYLYDGTRICKDSGSSDKVMLDNPLGKKTTPQILIGRIINALLGLVGSLALIMFIYGGFVWMTAGGNQEGVTKGKNVLLWATIGLVVIFASYALVSFIINKAIGVV